MLRTLAETARVLSPNVTAMNFSEWDNEVEGAGPIPLISVQLHLLTLLDHNCSESETLCFLPYKPC